MYSPDIYHKNELVGNNILKKLPSSDTESRALAIHVSNLLQFSRSLPKREHTTLLLCVQVFILADKVAPSYLRAQER